MSVNEHQLETDIKFMCPHGPSPSFYWPEQDDVCTIPYNQTISTIDTPSTLRSGRIYKLTRKSLKTIEENVHK